MLIDSRGITSTCARPTAMSAYAYYAVGRLAQTQGGATGTPIEAYGAERALMAFG